MNAKPFWVANWPMPDTHVLVMVVMKPSVAVSATKAEAISADTAVWHPNIAQDDEQHDPQHQDDGRHSHIVPRIGMAVPGRSSCSRHL